MATDFTGRTIEVGDVIVYGSTHRRLEYGMVVEITETERIGYQDEIYYINNIRVARIRRKTAIEYAVPGDYNTWQEVDKGEWIIGRYTFNSPENSVILSDNQCMNKIEFANLLDFRKEILAGIKKIKDKV